MGHHFCVVTILFCIYRIFRKINCRAPVVLLFFIFPYFWTPELSSPEPHQLIHNTFYTARNKYNIQHFLQITTHAFNIFRRNLFQSNQILCCEHSFELSQDDSNELSQHIENDGEVRKLAFEKCSTEQNIISIKRYYLQIQCIEQNQAFILWSPL